MCYGPVGLPYTSVFRTTKLVYDATVQTHGSGNGQSEAHFVTPTVPPPNRPILLHRSGRPFEPLPYTATLTGSLPEEAVRSWSGVGKEYIPQPSCSMAEATVSSALVASDQLNDAEEEVMEAYQEIKDVLAQARDLEGVYSSGDEALLLDIDADEEDSCEEAHLGRYSRMEGEKNVDPRRPILSIANRVKASVKKDTALRRWP